MMNFDVDFRSNSVCLFVQKVFAMREQDVLQSSIGFCTEMENEYAGIILSCDCFQELMVVKSCLEA